MLPSQQRYYRSNRQQRLVQDCACRSSQRSSLSVLQRLSGISMPYTDTAAENGSRWLTSMASVHLNSASDESSSKLTRRLSSTKTASSSCSSAIRLNHIRRALLGTMEAKICTAYPQLCMISTERWGREGKMNKHEKISKRNMQRRYYGAYLFWTCCISPSRSCPASLS